MFYKQLNICAERKMMTQIKWLYKPGGNFNEYYQLCVADKLSCPKAFIQYIWREVYEDPVLLITTADNPASLVVSCQLFYYCEQIFFNKHIIFHRSIY